MKLFKSKKLGKSNPYNAEFTVLVCVSMDNLKEFSNVKLSNVNMLDKINIEIIKKIKIKKAIFTSLSSIYGLDNLFFFDLNNFTKLSLIVFMILGKIEIIVVLYLIKRLVFRE